MNNTVTDRFKRTRAEFEVALDNFLAALDREHYPDSLYGSMVAVLKTESAPRGLPLFLQHLAQCRGKDFSSGLLVACESLLRAFLLLALLQIENNSKINKSLSSRLRKKYPQAHLLLTADTLFTWPMELVAAENVSGSGPLSVALAGAFGINGCLTALDSAGGSFAALMKLNPFMDLVRTLGLSDIESDRGIRPAARWLYCNELEHWFGENELISRESDGLEPELAGLVDCDKPQVRTLGQLVSFLRE